MDTLNRRRAVQRQRASTIKSAILTGTIALLVSCSGDCRESRRPPELPTRAGTEGSGLLSDRAPEGLSEGTGERQRPDHRQGEGTGSASTQRRSDDPVMAWVDDRQIYRSDLERRVRRRMARFRGAGRQMSQEIQDRERQRALQEMVEEELLHRYMAQENIVVTDEELADAISTEIEHVFHSDAHFERYLEQRGLTREDYAETKRFEMQLDRLWATRGSTEATEEQIREYYQNFRENWRAPERVLVSNISLRLARSASEDEFAAATEQLREIRRQIVEDGASFEQLARDRSQSPDRYRGGDMGWIYRDDRDLDERIAELLFNMGVGDVSEPIRSRIGVQIFTVRDHRSEGYREFEEVRDSLEGIVEQQSERALRTAIIHELESQYEVGYNEEEIDWEQE